MREVIKATKDNLEFFKTLIDEDLQEGDSIVRTKEKLEVRLTRIRLSPDSHLTPELMLGVVERYDKTFKDLVDR